MIKKSFFIIVLVIIASKVQAQTTLGIGIVSIAFDAQTRLAFYVDSLDKKPVRVLRFYNNPEIDAVSIVDLEKQRKWLKPEMMWLDYHVLNFRVLADSGRWFKVIVNNENGLAFWIKKTAKTRFKSWETYLKGMFSIARIPDYPQKIRTKPDEQSPEIAYTGTDCFIVKSVQGDWVEIATPDYCDNSYTGSTTRIRSGWIRWRDGNRLIIEYFFTS